MKIVNDIFSFLNELAPVELKMDFDNVGILVGSKNTAVSKCLLALDITDEVIQEAIDTGVQLIVSHHPVIFNAVKSITDDSLVGKKLIKLIKNDISAVCMHTNLDIAEGGVNDALMCALNAEAIGALDASGCGRVGEIKEETELSDFLKICKTALNSNGLRYHDAGLPVKKIAVMGGSGGDCIALAKALGCDTYVTSDIKYNGFLDAKELCINLIDADHYCTENTVIPVLYEKLCAQFADVEFVISEKHSQTARFY